MKVSTSWRNTLSKFKDDCLKAHRSLNLSLPLASLPSTPAPQRTPLNTPPIGKHHLGKRSKRPLETTLCSACCFPPRPTRSPTPPLPSPSHRDLPLPPQPFLLRFAAATMSLLPAVATRRGPPHTPLIASPVNTPGCRYPTKLLRTAHHRHN